MQWIRNIRTQRIKPLLQEQQAFYAQHRTPDEIRDWQLARFNEQWQSIRKNVPYFVRLAQERRLPERFAAWSEFSALLPVMDRGMVQSRAVDLRDSTRSPDAFRTTGGSTGEPVRIPVWSSELTFSNEDAWFARSWFGVSPADKLFLTWGHSHLLGSGWRGRLNGLKRAVKDSMLGYYRQSAYDLSELALRRAGEKLLQFKPAYVLGYSVALDRFARVNSDRRDEFHKLGLKVAVATAESFPRTDSADVVADVLGCPVAMEYGTVETGVMAHQRSDKIYSVFWKHYFVEGVAAKEVSGTWELLVTALYPRCFPLVRYRLGDLISEDPDSAIFNQTFQRVIGRCNDCITLPDGFTVHSEAFTHTVKECAFVSAFQVVQEGSGRIQLRYVPAGGSAADELEILRRLSLIHPALQNIELQRVATLPQTVAGKTRRVVRDMAVHTGIRL